MSDPSPSDFLRALNAEQKRVAFRAWVYVVGYLLLTTTPHTYLDFYHWDVYGAYVWVGFYEWAVTYLLLLIVMKNGEYFAQGKSSGIGTYFVLALVTGIAISLALIVFILPGLYLLMRWLPVYARALTAEEWVGQSMRWSWEATERFQKPLSLALLGLVLCYGISLAALFSYDKEVMASYQLAMIVMNLALNLAAAWFTVLGVAAFGMLRELGLRKGAPDLTAEPA